MFSLEHQWMSLEPFPPHPTRPGSGVAGQSGGTGGKRRVINESPARYHGRPKRLITWHSFPPTPGAACAQEESSWVTIGAGPHRGTQYCSKIGLMMAVQTA